MPGFLEEKCKPLIGVVHLPPLPGSFGYGKLPYPSYHGKTWTLEEIVDYAVSEASKYEEAGFDAVIVENYGDRPYTIRAGPGQVASMTRIVSEVVRSVSIPVGVNILRNSAYEALYVAYVTGASFIRVNNLCEYRVSLEGAMEPAVRDVAKAISELDIYRDVAEGKIMVLGDVDVKHSYPVASRYEARDVVEDCLSRAGFTIHAVIISGRSTGEEPEVAYVEELAGPARRHGLRVIIGSGVSADNIASYWRLADAFIVGTSVKLGGITENVVSLDKAKALARLAAHYRRTWPCPGSQ